MNRLSVVIDDISLVLQQYDKVKVYRATSEDGVYAELTGASTRIDIVPETRVYFFTDDVGDNTHWYKTSYYHSVTTDESELSAARQGGTEEEKIGYTFDNYSAPPDEWGKLLTSDDIRYTYLFGIDSIANDVAQSEFSDEQFDAFVRAAMGDFELYLTMDIRKRVYKTDPADSDIRGRVWRTGVDYTDLEDDYDFIPEEWKNHGFVQLRHWPVISVDRAVLYSQVKTEVIDLLDQNWVRLTRDTGQIRLFPKGGYAYGPFSVGAMPWRLMGMHYPGGFEFDYTTGYPKSDFVPEGLRDVVGKWAAVKCLASIGDGLMAGFSSQSVSLDGLSESFSSTQSATSAFFGARILEYTKEIDSWIKKNRYKFGAVPMAFVGV